MKKLRHIEMTLFLAVMMQENYSPSNGEKSFFDQTKLRLGTFYPQCQCIEEQAWFG